MVPSVTVAVLNPNENTLEPLQAMLESHGYRVAVGYVGDVRRGSFDFVQFIREHDPRVIVWNIGPPFDRNWAFLQLVQTGEMLEGRRVIVTTTHREQLDAAVATDTHALEVIGRPRDLENILAAVRAYNTGADAEADM
jgi:DNA-binding response OmpR family regulator